MERIIELSKALFDELHREGYNTKLTADIEYTQIAFLTIGGVPVMEILLPDREKIGIVLNSKEDKPC
ncbi:hypothetical protein LPY66_18405 [Dehalobacter sp. DCM]|uniref:hypothetical protein n=1 Tax=Dehalobacter sp. DCM TaxID=2907827 RepID=UPI0030817802|nr:hypothetical protein LPY66_18405 [Dehalobacter sp. DCM]